MTGENCVYLEWSEIVFIEGKGTGTLLRAGVKRELPLSFTLLSIGKGWTKPHFFLTFYLQLSYFPTDVTGNTFNCYNLQAWPGVNEKRI